LYAFDVVDTDRHEEHARLLVAISEKREAAQNIGWISHDFDQRT
jgi:hypothetical protein